MPYFNSITQTVLKYDILNKNHIETWAYKLGSACRECIVNNLG